MEIKNIEEIAAACNEFDYYNVVEAFESANISDEDERDYGLFQDYITILPNVPKTKEIVNNVKPIAEGKYWLVYKFEDVDSNMRDELDENNLYFLDCITENIFED